MKTRPMHRRSVLTLLGASTAAWPLAGRAQQRPRLRRIGVLLPGTPDDPRAQLLLAAFAQGLQPAGWTVGGNVHFEMRFAAGSAEQTRKLASELVSLAPDVILAHGSSTVGPLLQATS